MIQNASSSEALRPEPFGHASPQSKATPAQMRASEFGRRMGQGQKGLGLHLFKALGFEVHGLSVWRIRDVGFRT